jgi:two-component system NarL family response regulator
VLVVDDHAAMREGISAVVNAQSDMTIAGQASDGQQAIERFRDLRPDVALLDWNLPHVQGEEVLTSLRKEFPAARFIIITALTEDECIRRALHLGAQAFLHKDTLRRELLSAIRAVHGGHQYLSAEIANRLKQN